MSIKFTTVPSKRLAESITGSSTTFKVNNISGWDGVDLTSASFGTRLWAVFRNSAGTLMEIMEVDPASVTSASSPITIILRGLKFDGDQTTSVAANKLTWVKGDTIVELGTHVPQLLQSTTIIPTPVIATDPANKGYVDTIAILGAADASTVLKGIGRVAQSPTLTIGVSTITIASPAVVTFTSHGLIANDSIQFTKTGSLPTGLSPSTTYYVISTGLTVNTFQVSATYGGTAINTSGSQSGVHTLYRTTPVFVGDNDTRLPSASLISALTGSQGTPSSTNKFITQDNTTALGTDQSQTTQNGTQTVGMADTTGLANKTVESFIPLKTTISGVKLYKVADTGTFTGTVTVALQADSSGNPSGSNLASVTLTNAQWLAIQTGEFSATFSTEYSSIVAGSLYWIVITTSTSDSSNHPNLGLNTAGGYANGTLKRFNTTDSWVTIATSKLYFKTIEGILNQVVKTDSTGKLPALDGSNLSKVNASLMGPDKNSTVKTSINTQLPFILWTGAVNNDTNTPFANWTRASAATVNVGPMGQYSDFIGSGVASMILDIRVFLSAPSSVGIKFQDAQTYTYDFFAKFPASGTGDIGAGFGSNSASYASSYNSTTADLAGFNISAAGVLYATTRANGVGVTNTNISAGITITNWNHYRVEINGTTATFYVNGILRATLANTNFPTSGAEITLGFGRSNTSLFLVTAPNMSVQLI